jgi:alkaline phosphatase
MNPTRISIPLISYVMIVTLLLGGNQTKVSLASPIPKNIIIMIGDGMGYNQSLSASNYRFGAPWMQNYNDFPFKIAVSTNSADGWGYDPALAWNDFQYVKTRYTDSAAAATAMATGKKTYNTGIGVDVNGNPVGNVFETAETMGKSTGVVTTVEFSHATPAGFVAHNVSRENYMAIANEMIYASNTDVIMGAGHPWFNNNGQVVAVPNTFKYVGGETTWDALVAGTVSSDRDNDNIDETAVLIQEKSQFEALMTGPTPEFVVGVAQVYTTLQQGRGGNSMADPYVVPLNGNVPNLTEMSLAAINILDNNPNGFGLMVEGGAIDWAAHLNQPGRTIEEQIDFDKAVEAVVNWVETNSNWAETLLIVTGDHETGYLWGPGSNPTWKPLINNGVGVLPGMQFNSPNHTNSLIPMYVRGDAAHWFSTMLVGVDPIRGKYVDNTSIAQVIFKVLNAYKLFLPVIERSG